MTLKRLALSLVLLFALLPTFAQQPVATNAVARDPQAVAVIQQALAAMGPFLPSDSTATGTITIATGTQSTQGTIRILTKGTTESLVQTATPSATNSVIFSNGLANQVVGSTTTSFPEELIVTSQAAEFPTPLLAALINDPNTSFQYIGVETSNGQTLQHVRTWNTFASQPDWQAVSSFSTRDIWIDSSGLPVRISYVRRAAHGAVGGMAVDFYFSNYHMVQGLLYPMTIQKSLNGTPAATITIQSVSFNVGLSDSDFPVQ
jgi:outer membrane lipoprotein-sorting protein